MTGTTAAFDAGCASKTRNHRSKTRNRRGVDGPGVCRRGSRGRQPATVNRQSAVDRRLQPPRLRAWPM
eukprot:220057-Chlamydomonas_euryale.AAC.1